MGDKVNLTVVFAQQINIHMKISDIISESFLEEGRHDQHIFKSVFVIGPPGSGKNTIAQKFMSRYHFKQEDIDQVLHRHQQLRTKKQANPVDYAATSPLVLKQRKLWQDNYLPIVFNTTGRRFDRIAELKQSLEQTGYDTLCVFVYVTPETAWNRTVQRAQHSTNPADKGRTVDKDYFDSTYEAIKASAVEYKKMFGGKFVFYVNDETLSGQETQQYQSVKTISTINQFINGPVQNPIGQRIISGNEGK